MPLQATSGAASYDAFGGGVPFEPIYIESCFATHLYTGNGSTQTINNGIDLAGKGGLVWIKQRNAVIEHFLYDTTRGALNVLESNSTTAAYTASNTLTAFGSTGFTLGSSNFVNGTTSGPRNYVSWTFREQPKFFTTVTYTGTGSTQTIAHNLGSVPGCIIVKATNDTRSWAVYHRSLGATKYIYLNSTGIGGTTNGFWDDTEPTSTAFTVRNDGDVNGPGTTYVAYLFAHNAGGFGLTGTDNVISCGSYTGNGTSGLAVTLGYEPQWVMVKCSSAAQADGWIMVDNMRGMDNTGNQWLKANTSGAESAESARIIPTATGFTLSSNAAVNTSGATYIYIAIRRGPMKTPTTGTSVFAPALASSSGTYTATSNFPVDWAIEGDRASTTKFFAGARLTGDNTLQPNTTGAESAQSWGFANMTGFTLPGVVGNYSGFINWMFRRAPGFFDVVCYTGNGINGTTQSHNLGVVPEMWIVKRRSTADSWVVGTSARGSNVVELNLADGEYDAGTAYFSNGSVYTAPTSSVIWLGSNARVNQNGGTFVAYLFASCPGVSKVFNYTGNGSSQTINCGFTGGARFVMIKRTDSTGDWYVWDTARGIVANNDPHLSLNTTAAEVTTNDTIDTDSTGFVVNQVSATNVNVNGASYIGLAIA